MDKITIKDIFQDTSYYAGFITSPVSLAEAKAHLYIETSFTNDDTLIQGFIDQSINTIENFCNISIIGKLLTVTYNINSNAGPYRRDPDYGFSGFQRDCYPFTDSWQELPYGPVKYIFTVTGINQSTIANMALNTDFFIQGVQFKDIRFGPIYSSYLVVYQTGWDTIPNALKLAILNEVAFRYENRGDQIKARTGEASGLCEASEYLAKPFQRIQL